MASDNLSLAIFFAIFKSRIHFPNRLFSQIHSSFLILMVST